MRDGRQHDGCAAHGVVAVLAVTLSAGLGAAGMARAASTALEVTPTIGWQWGGTLDYGTGGTVHANAALNYGGAIGAQIRPGEWGEISYSYQSSEVIARPPAAKSFKIFDLGTHYVQLSGARNLMNVDPGQLKAYPYVIGGLGMTIFSPGSASVVNVNTGTQYLFSMSVGGGLRIQMSDNVDIRLQSRLLLPMNFESGGFYFGSGGGGVAVSGGTLMPQGEATVGLAFKLGEKK